MEEGQMCNMIQFLQKNHNTGIIQLNFCLVIPETSPVLGLNMREKLVVVNTCFSCGGDSGKIALF